MIDGKELAQLMIEHGVGVTNVRQYKLKRLDLDYFATDEDSDVLVDVATPSDETPEAMAGEASDAPDAGDPRRTSGVP